MRSKCAYVALLVIVAFVGCGSEVERNALDGLDRCEAAPGLIVYIPARASPLEPAPLYDSDGDRIGYAIPGSGFSETDELVFPSGLFVHWVESGEVKTPCDWLVQTNDWMEALEGRELTRESSSPQVAGLEACEAPPDFVGYLELEADPREIATVYDVAGHPIGYSIPKYGFSAEPRVPTDSLGYMVQDSMKELDAYWHCDWIRWGRSIRRELEADLRPAG